MQWEKRVLLDDCAVTLMGIMVTEQPVKFVIMFCSPVAKNCNVRASRSSGDIAFLQLLLL